MYLNKESIPLISAIVGVTVLLSPLPIQVKLTTGIAGIGLCTHQAISAKAKQNRRLRFEAKNAKEIELKQAELDTSLNVLAIAEAELLAKRQRWEAEEKEQKEALRVELSRKEDELLLGLEQEERRQRKRLEADLEANKQAILGEMNLDIEERKAVLNALETERKEKLEQINKERLDRLELVKAEVERGRKQWEKEKEEQRDRDRQELKKLQDELTEAFLEEKENLQKELEYLQKQLHQQAKADYESWLIPHCQEMSERIREVERLKATIQMLREQMAEDRDIRLCNEHGTVHGDRANAVLTWLKNNAVYCDYVSSTILPDGTYVLNFEPWEVGSKAEKKIKGMLLACQVRFGLQEPPLFEPNGEARAWCLKMFPARARSTLNLEQWYTQMLPETRLGESFRDIEPAIRDGVARQINYQEQVAEMMAFTPPVPLQKPRSHQLTELELMCFRWFYFWRGLATEGEEENITTREGLLYYVYGVKEGRRSHTHDPILGESLGMRVKRVLQIFEAEKNTDLEMEANSNE